MPVSSSNDGARMTGAQQAISLAAAYDLVAVHLAGTSESTPLRAVAAE